MALEIMGHQGLGWEGDAFKPEELAAVLFAAIVFYPDQSLYIIPIPVPIPAPLFGIGYLAYTWYAARNPHGRINHDAHLGGAIAGLAYVALVEPRAFSYLLNSLF